jgi:anti-sigma B factor antagonist
MDFAVSTRQGPTGTVVEVSGELDMNTTPQLRDRLEEVVRSGARSVVVDLTNVAFMDSSGLGALVVAYKDLRERDGWLGLAGARPVVRTVLSITATDRIFAIFDTARDAEEAAPAQA